MPKHDPTVLSDEEARIQAGIAQDPDNPEWTEEDFKAAKPFVDVFPEMAAALRKRGPTGTKELISIRIDRDVLQAFKATGPGWQTRMNEALAEAARKLRAA